MDELASVSGWTLTAQEADYLTSISDNVALVFLCLHIDCLLLRHEPSVGQGQINAIFKCPKWARVYQPWVTSRGRVNAQKLLQIRDPTSGVFTRFACTWPGGSDDKWLLSQAEAHARNVNVPENAEAFLRKEACSLHDRLENQKIPDGLQTFKFNHNLVWNFTQTQKGKINWDESCWAHILDGFQGN
ncbi:hypothetical protein, partial [Limnohabitans sp.]|uniref:hypothetical protein n=1 Tax=Limnohabitans sp. TaxID=1907725 RepID=UPI00333E8AF6